MIEQILSKKVYGPSDYKERPWAGGKTRELFIYPPEASYDERNFIFRLSSATIEKEETQFTLLPDYDRSLMVLEGEVILSFEGKRVCRLSQWEQDNFDGKETTRSFGKIKDYNLIVLKGSLGSLEAIPLKKERQPICIPSEFRCSPFQGLTLGLYCAEGYLLLATGDDIIRVNQDEQLILELDPGDTPTLGIMGEGMAISSLVAYVNEPIMEEIPKSKTITWPDIKASFFIAYTNFRGAGFLFKSQKELWYDHPLRKAINRIERFHLPLLIFILGLLFVIYTGLQWGGTQDLWKWIAGWVALDYLVVTPAMFVLTLPRPIRKHMKLVKTLTPYEKCLYEKEKLTNIRLEKLLKKYAISGRNVGDEHKGKDYKSFRQ